MAAAGSEIVRAHQDDSTLRMAPVSTRAEIDTSAPFESVKEAATRFGGMGFWRPTCHKASENAYESPCRNSLSPGLGSEEEAEAESSHSAEKIIADARKAYFGTRQGPTLLPTIDKAQAAKIQEQENLLRNAVNHGEGLRLPGEHRQVTSSLPMHLVDVLSTCNGTNSFSDSSGMYQKNTPPLLSAGSNNTPGPLLQASGAQLVGRAATSPSGATGSTPFDNTAASPMQYANSPRSGANIMNTPSPQQHQPHQQYQVI